MKRGDFGGFWELGPPWRFASDGPVLEAVSNPLKTNYHSV